MKRLIKVLHIIPDLSRGGGQQVAIHLLRGMDRSRFEPMAMSMFGRLGAPIEAQLDEENLKVVYLQKRLGMDWRAVWRIFNVLRQLKPDVVHTHLNCLRYALPAIAAMKRNLVVVHTVHNLAEHEVGRLDRMLYRFAFKHLPVVQVAIAEAVQASCRKVYGLNPPLIPNGIPHRTYQAGPQGAQWREDNHIAADEFVLVNVGRLSPQKNQMLLLEAVSMASREASKLCCLIVGDGPLAEQLEEKIGALSLQNVVRLLGHRTDIPQILAAADAGVLCSNWEGNPLCLMEMMAAGLPVIATAVGGVPELVPDGAGILIEPGDAPGIANAIRSLASDRVRRHDLGNVAAQVAQSRFSVEQMTSQYEKLYVAQLELRSLTPQMQTGVCH